MKLWVNGQLEEVPDGLSVGQLLERRGLASDHVAVEVNAQVVRRALHAAHRLAPDDRVEIVTFVGGG